ncbi:hypothetical protein [Candidatus Kryptonium thompsonii]
MKPEWYFFASTPATITSTTVNNMLNIPINNFCVLNSFLSIAYLFLFV